LLHAQTASGLYSATGYEELRPVPRQQCQARPSFPCRGWSAEAHCCGRSAVPSRCAASLCRWRSCDIELTRISGSSFAENFYGLRRRRRPGLSSSRTKGFSATPRASLARYEALRPREIRASLFLLVAAPYLKGKLHDAWERVGGGAQGALFEDERGWADEVSVHRRRARECSFRETWSASAKHCTDPCGKGRELHRWNAPFVVSARALTLLRRPPHRRG
jgi:hypothetical protein